MKFRTLYKINTIILLTLYYTYGTFITDVMLRITLELYHFSKRKEQNKMGACKTLKHILLDKGKTITALAEEMGKPRQTVANVFFKDGISIKKALEYGEALNCSLYYIDNETGQKYKIEP